MRGTLLSGVDGNDSEDHTHKQAEDSRVPETRLPTQHKTDIPREVWGSVQLVERT